MINNLPILTFIAVAIFHTNFAISAPVSSQSNLINNQGDVIGNVTLTQGTEGILVEINVSSLPPGKHGLHFHEVGNCDDHSAFKHAKGHVMPEGKPHGFLNKDGPHAGNLPNLIVHNDGTAHVELYSQMVSLYPNSNKPALHDTDGSALIIHSNEDDHITQPIGGSGERIACAVIH